MNSAAFSDILVRFYTGEPGGFFGPQPIGMPAGKSARGHADDRGGAGEAV